MNTKYLKKKIKSKHGFTLAETLIAVLILLMVSAIVVAGIPAAKNAYEKVVMASNAEVLLSTTISTLRNELGTAQDVEAPDDETITYYNATRGAPSKLFLTDGEKKELKFQRYSSKDDMGAESEATLLISPETATSGLYLTCSGIEYEDGIVTFSDLAVNSPNTTDLAKRDKLSIRVISENKGSKQ